MSTMTTFLTSPVRLQDGTVKLKKYDGTPQRQWERAAAHALLVFAVACMILGAYLLATSNLGPAEEPTPVPNHQPVQEKPAQGPLLNA